MCADHEPPRREEADRRALWENFARGEGSIAERLMVAGRNVARRGSRRAGCCGNYGQPGC